MSDVRITLSDMRGLGYCNRGARAWAERHGIDWRAFRREGLPADVLEGTGDAMAIRLVNEVRRGQK